MSAAAFVAGTLAPALSRAELTPFLRGIVFVGEAALGSGLDFQSVSLGRGKHR